MAVPAHSRRALRFCARREAPAPVQNSAQAPQFSAARVPGRVRRRPLAHKWSHHRGHWHNPPGPASGQAVRNGYWLLLSSEQSFKPTANLAADIAVAICTHHRLAAGDKWHQPGIGTALSSQGLGLGIYPMIRSEEHTSELQSRPHLVCRLLLEKKKNNKNIIFTTNKTQINQL